MRTTRICGRNAGRSIVAAALAVGVLAAGPAAAQQAVRIGTSSAGSSFYVVAIAMSKMVQKYAGFNATVEPLGGSHANMFGLARDKVDFAVANSGAAFDRYHGNKPFKKPFDLRLVAQGQPTLRTIIARKGSGIKKPEDLIGKTVSAKRRPLPELEKIMNALIKVYNLPKNKIKLISSVNLGEVNRTLRAGSVDAAAMPFSLRQPVMTKLFNDAIIEPLILPEDKYMAMKRLLPDMFYKFRVKANHFKNQPKAWLVFGLKTLLTTSAKMPADTVYKITKAIMGHHKEFSKYHAAARRWTVTNTMKDAKVPFHPGAIRFYKEVGAWTPAMAKLQAKLLKR